MSSPSPAGQASSPPPATELLIEATAEAVEESTVDADKGSSDAASPEELGASIESSVTESSTDDVISFEAINEALRNTAKD